MSDEYAPWKEITMTQEAGLQEAEYAYERISAERDALVRKGYCVHGWLQENGDGTQTCLAGCGQTFPDFDTAMNAEALRFEESRVVAQLGGRQRRRLGERAAAVR
jgi:hypothetical protein